jgi:hypothetical protein
MSGLRASYTISPEVLRKFNELVLAGEQSQVIEGLMKRALIERRRQFEALAEEFETHPDFAEARADGAAFDVTIGDGLADC